MRLLVITNLYPPQELGGYGRCLSDFVWGLRCLGHFVTVLCSDAPYLNKSSTNLSDDPHVFRTLQLKGTYENGLTSFNDPSICRNIDLLNQQVISSMLTQDIDGILLGNLDLIGFQFFPSMLRFNIPVLHHIGFVSPPFSPHPILSSTNYHMLPASAAVAHSLSRAGFDVSVSNVVYPGARTDLFSPHDEHLSSSLSFALSQASRGIPLGSPSNPLKIGFAGLLMASKGVHTLVKATIQLIESGFSVQLNLAGHTYDMSYKAQLQHIISRCSDPSAIKFFGNLDRTKLVRFWERHHVGVFPSIYPEAFGISAAEIMASGLVLISSGVGGASELFINGQDGLSFQASNSRSLVQVFNNLLANTSLFARLTQNSYRTVRENFSVISSCQKLSSLFKSLR